MGALVQPTALSLVLRHLPGPVLRVLDAWSARVARRRWEQRQRRWQERRAPVAAPAATATPYQLRPWRD